MLRQLMQEGSADIS